MRKLLRANFARLWKDKVFWGALVVLACYGVLGCISQYRLVEEGIRWIDQYSSGYSNVHPFNEAVSRGVYCNCFQPEYSDDGTIRNKLVTGASRMQIYLSNYVTCTCAGLLMQTAYSLVVSAVAIPMFGIGTPYLESMAIYSGIGILLICSETAIYTMISMLCQNKAAAAVFCQVGTFILLFAAMYILSLKLTSIKE